MASASEPSVTLDLKEAAHSMIARASDNSDRLGLARAAKMLEFKHWFYEHVVGAESDVRTPSIQLLLS